MSVTPWMAKKVTGKMSNDAVHERVVAFLKKQTMCVLSTCSKDMPRATPVEYYSNGTTLYIMADPGVKVENIKVNPRICVGVFTVVHPVWTQPGAWDTAAAAQITGRATLLVDESSPEYAEALRHYKWQIFLESVGMDTSKPPPGRPFIKVEADKIEYMEFALKKEGFSSKQTWVRPASGK